MHTTKEKRNIICKRLKNDQEFSYHLEYVEIWITLYCFGIMYKYNY